MYDIREYNIKDKEQVIKLWLDVCVKEHDFKEWEEDISLIEDKEYEKILVALFNSEVIGTMAYKKIDNETVELKRVYLYPEHRGQGIAKKLYNTILDIIRENRYKKILVETWEKFQSGRNFYEKNGFILKNIQNEVYNYILEL